MDVKSLESELKKIKFEISSYDGKSEALEFLQLLNKRREISEKISRIKWNNLSLNEKILKRKEDLSLTSRYFEKFKEEVEQKYLFKKSYVQLIDNIQVASFNSSLLIVLLKSLNTSMYVDIDNKDFNIPYLIEELEKTKNSQLSEIISAYQQIITFQKPI